jgi:hypothetical protein
MREIYQYAEQEKTEANGLFYTIQTPRGVS